jgi:hypothetical protein
MTDCIVPSTSLYCLPMQSAEDSIEQKLPEFLTEEQAKTIVKSFEANGYSVSYTQSEAYGRILHADRITDHVAAKSEGERADTSTLPIPCTAEAGSKMLPIPELELPEAAELNMVSTAPAAFPAEKEGVEIMMKPNQRKAALRPRQTSCPPQKTVKRITITLVDKLPAQAEKEVFHPITMSEYIRSGMQITESDNLPMINKDNGYCVRCAQVYELRAFAAKGTSKKYFKMCVMCRDRVHKRVRQNGDAMREKKREKISEKGEQVKTKETQE